MREYRIHPMKLNGIEFTLSLMYMIILIIIMCFLPCREKGFEDGTGPNCSMLKIDDVIMGIWVLQNNWVLTILVYLIILATIISCTFAIFVTHMDSALARVTIS